jgi:hypothetical protein
VYKCMGDNPAHKMTCLKDVFGKDKWLKYVDVLSRH